MKQKNLEYNIGLDIGTNSVGWAVTDLNNNLLKYKNKNMWGARIFEEGTTAKTTRTFRGTRRRLERRKERIKILQSLLLNDMEKEYPNFFPMLQETYKLPEEKSENRKYNLFADINMNDKNYYNKYPTIYHLRNELMENKEKYDIRLVYLAIHHIIKYRGNFLYEADLEASNDSILEDIKQINQYLFDNMGIEYLENEEEFRNILIDKKESKGNKKDKLLKLYDYDKNQKSVVDAVISAIIGYKFNLDKILDEEIIKNTISFSEEIENEDEIKEKLGDNLYLYESLQKIYNYFVLQDILQNEKSISKAFIKKYEKYKGDLNQLKKIYKDYLPLEYNSMFRKPEANNYVNYDNKKEKARLNLCSTEDFYKRIKKDLEIIENCKEKEEILKKIDNKEFLVKINSTENATIPYQLNYQELEKILDNQSEYYETIKENKDKILSLMEFRIPYYVGPLDKNNQSKFAWIIRKTNEKILPWNFEDVVDTQKTAEEFIRRMTNKCTYLLNEDVIPKQSILYSEFCVLNELSNIRINNQKLTPKVKKQIIEELFKKNKTVTEKQLKEKLLEKQLYTEINSITGFAQENKFASNMSAYIDMSKILGQINDENIEMIEKIIEWITIFEDKKILKEKIKVEYNLEPEIIKKLAKLKYTGWSRLSKKLLTGLKAVDDGKSIMEKLESTKENFMQIINNDKYGFNKQIEEKMPKVDKNITYEQIEEIPTSPANKRSIWQTIKIVQEITKIMKCEPQNIYVEFARNEEEKKRIDSRAKALLKIYNKYEEEINELKINNSNIYKELKDRQNEKDFNERLFLYFTQMGKCLYSGKPLNIDTLYLYEIDHIMPQSYIKDDSLSNKALVYKECNQRKSGNLLLLDDIINKQQAFWKQLHKIGLMDDKKYNNLIRRKMFETDNDKAKFVARQLVETRQSTKYITNLLVNQYKKSNVFAIRAELTAGIRGALKIYKNRNVNDYHHAQDAYIISLVGNVIDTKMQYKDEFKYTEYVKNYIKKQIENEEKAKEKKSIIIGMVLNNIDKEKAKKNLYYKDCYITHKLEEQTGEFYNQTLYSPKDKSKNIQIPVKNNKNAEKYGGYSGQNKAYFTIYSYIDEKQKSQTELIGIPIKIAYDIKNEKITLLRYLQNQNLNATNIKIIKPKILKYQEYLDENNNPMAFLSDLEIKANKQLILSKEMNKLVYLMNKEKKTDVELEEVNSKLDEIYEYLLEKLKREYKMFESISKKLNEERTREKFKKVSNSEKIITINGIIDLMQRGQGNLEKIAMGNRAGRMSGKKFKTERLKNMTFIDKSITGMYERRYKINGMENSSNK